MGIMVLSSMLILALRRPYYYYQCKIASAANLLTTSIIVYIILFLFLFFDYCLVIYIINYSIDDEVSCCLTDAAWFFTAIGFNFLRRWYFTTILSLYDVDYRSLMLRVRVGIILRREFVDGALI